MSSISIIKSCNMFKLSYCKGTLKEQAINIEALIKHGLDVNKRYERGETMLFHASSKGNKYAVEILLENKADPNIPGEYGSYPLYEAVNNNHEDIALLLLESGAKVMKTCVFRTGVHRFPILHSAAHFGFTSLIKPLIEAGADMNEISDFMFPRSTALDIALQRNNLEFADELYSLGYCQRNNVFNIKRGA